MSLSVFLNFFCDASSVSSHIKDQLNPLIKAFTTVSVEHFDRFVKSHGLDRSSFDGMCDGSVSYLSFTTLAYQAQGFWDRCYWHIESFDYPEDSEQSNALIKYSQVVKTLKFPSVLEIQSLIEEAIG